MNGQDLKNSLQYWRQYKSAAALINTWWTNSLQNVRSFNCLFTGYSYLWNRVVDFQTLTQIYELAYFRVLQWLHQRSFKNWYLQKHFN